MKKFLFCTFFLVYSGLISFGQVDTAKQIIPHYNCVDQPKNGTWNCHYSNGVINQVYNFKNGKMDGIQKSFHSNGQLTSEAYYSIGRKNGTYTTWDKNGNKICILNWIDGNKNGEQIFWHTSGGIERKEYYSENKRTGIWNKWHENGQLKSKIEYDGWTIVRDYGYWNNQGVNIENEIERRIDAEKLRSDTNKNIATNWHDQSNALIEELFEQTKISKTHVLFFQKIINNRKTILNERIDSLNYDYIILTEEFNLTDSTIYVYEEYCFPAKKEETAKRGYSFNNYAEISSFSCNYWEEYISEQWVYDKFEEVLPQTYSYPMGCIFPASRRTQREFKKYKKKIEQAGAVIDPYLKIITVINGRTGAVSISIQIPKKGIRTVEKRYGLF